MPKSQTASRGEVAPALRPASSTMAPDVFRRWRQSLGMKQKDAAERLGLKKRVIQYYEKGHRGGKPVEIPRTVELACLALTLGHERFDPALLPAETPPDAKSA